MKKAHDYLLILILATLPAACAQKDTVQYSSKYTFQGRPLTLEEEKQWEQVLEQQRLLTTMQLNQQISDQAIQGLASHGDRISQQIDFMGKKNACTVAGNCSVERVPALP